MQGHHGGAGDVRVELRLPRGLGAHRGGGEVSCDWLWLAACLPLIGQLRVPGPGAPPELRQAEPGPGLDRDHRLVQHPRKPHDQAEVSASGDYLCSLYLFTCLCAV